MKLPAIPPFHLALPVRDLQEARAFYGGLLNCTEGRSSTHWIDFNFYGHQLVAHLGEPLTETGLSDVDGKAVPAFHFGLILPWQEWQELADHLGAQNLDFEIAPHIRFEGEVGEQATMFFRDPSGNAIEIKSFRDETQIFAQD